MFEKSLNITLFNVKLIQLKNDGIDFYILHIGKVSTFLNIYFINNNIQYTSPKGIDIENLEIDVALINKDGGSYDYSLNFLNNAKITVTYTTKNYIISKEGFIHSSLIPILIKYLFKIKESISFIKYNDVKNRSWLFLRKVRAIIDKNIDDPKLSVKRISNLMYMSRSTFSKRIKSRTGLKPTEFINHYKLEKSKHLLIASNWQINRISDALGFCSQQYYCRLFKTKEGINPLKYRKKHREVIL